MSVLETPRLMFRGQITFDPIVTNNQPQQYDESDARTVFAPGEGTAAFRKAAIDAVVGGGNWNPQGTHRSTFFNTAVVSVDTGSGPSADDPIVNTPVAFIGMLVDLEPYGSTSSQLFFDSMSFGIAGGCRVFAPRTTRMAARYINFGRNTTYNPQINPNVVAGGASVVWQTSFPKQDGLRLDQHDSPVLQKFAQKLEDDDVLGLTVRWNAYLTAYFDSLDPNNNPKLAQQLQAKLNGGGFQPNPARSRVVGALGLWRKGEPPNEPGDRTLLTDEAPIMRVAMMGSAFVRLAADSLTLDLGNSVPEIGTDLTKFNLGDLTAVAVGSDGQLVATLGTFGYDKYDREAYERAAGIVTIKVDPAAAGAAQTADIQLRKSDKTVVLAEAALRAIAVTPNVYLDEGSSTTVDVQVLARGKSAGAGVKVTMADASGSVATTASATTDARGIATFPVRGVTGQVDQYVLLPGDATSVRQLDPQLVNYLNVRTLPADGKIARLSPTWDNVYASVLRNWHAMAPCMDNWLDLADPDQVKAFASLLRKLTDKANFEAFRFMPVTRDMTAGERTLLYAFLDGMTAAPEAPMPRPSLQQLSRSLRGG
jgi:hypothetical protein